jgi:uncharacterized protein (DUF58 family)
MSARAKSKQELSEHRWLPTRALSTALGILSALLVLAVLLRRQDLLIIALPLACSVFLGVTSRARDGASVRLVSGTAMLREGQRTHLGLEVRVADDLDLVRLETPTEGWIELTGGGRDFCLSVSADTPVTVSWPLTALRWGRGSVGPVKVTSTTALGLLQAASRSENRLSLSTAPLQDSFDAIDAIPIAGGIVGGHRSRRPGDGSDLAGVRPFVLGDRLHRINWPVSARIGSLHVTTTYSDQDVEMVLVLDPSVDIGVSGGVRGSASTLDVAVRAAAAIAEHYLRNGDRVGLVNLGRSGRPVMSRSGRGQLLGLMNVLLDLQPGEVAKASMDRALASIKDRALTVILTPLLGSDVPAHAASLARSGRSVLVVDTLPEKLQLPEPDEWTDLAWRMKLLERSNISQALVEHGVPVVPWHGPGSLDEVLAGLSRSARAPRVRR